MFLFSWNHTLNGSSLVKKSSMPGFCSACGGPISSDPTYNHACAVGSDNSPQHNHTSSSSRNKHGRVSKGQICVICFARIPPGQLCSNDHADLTPPVPLTPITVHRRYGRSKEPKPQNTADPTTPNATTLTDDISQYDDLSAVDMSLFPSFLTDHSGPSPSANRQPPSATHPSYPSSQQQSLGGPNQQSLAQGQQLQQQQQQQNGYSMGPAGGPGGGVNVFPTAAGHQLDLNHLWGQVQELSGLLERNRESTQGIVRRVGEIRSRARAGVGENGDGDGDGVEGLLRGLAVNGNGENGQPPPDLHTRVYELEANNAELEAENAELMTLVSTYESSLARILDQLRVYAHDHTLATLAIHKSYTQQLAAERSTNLELRQEYCEFQSRLGALAGLVREGLKWEDDASEGGGREGLKAVEAWAELQNENRVLRRLSGLAVESEGEGRK